MKLIKPCPFPSKIYYVLLGAVCALHAVLAFAADPGWPQPGQPRAVPDAVFLQEIGRKAPTTFALTSLAVYEGQVYAGSAKGLYRLQGDALAAVENAPAPVLRLVSAKGALWAITGRGLSRFQAGRWQTMSQEQIADVCEHSGGIIAASPRQLWRVAETKLEPVSTASCPFDMTSVTSYCETLYAAGEGRLTLFDGDRFGLRNVWKWETDNVWDWGGLTSTAIRDILSLDNRLYLATERGLGVLRGMALTQIRGEQGLCYEDTTCLAKGFGDDLWIGTSRGAIRHTAGAFHYFAGQRWLPDDRVNAITASDHTVFIATDRGLGIIDYEPYTLFHLAFLCYPNLLKYETDPRLRSIYRRSFERSWEIERIEQLPWFNFVYGSVTGNECEVEPAVNHLREWPLDLVIYTYRNSHRADLYTPPGYVAYSGGIRPFSPREREPMLWDNWTMKADGGTGGSDVVQPSSWLLAYWMGRYHGFIEAPTVTDPGLVRAGPNSGKNMGAKPYDGPQRPDPF